MVWLVVSQNVTAAVKSCRTDGLCCGKRLSSRGLSQDSDTKLVIELIVETTPSLGHGQVYDFVSGCNSEEILKAGPRPLDLSFWSFWSFLHHGIDEVERYLL